MSAKACREIANDETTDIVELDAASNSGVSDVHELQDQLAYTPVSCKYRVYILDEVHMLSTAAFNALLKTIRGASGACYLHSRDHGASQGSRDDTFPLPAVRVPQDWRSRTVPQGCSA